MMSKARGTGHWPVDSAPLGPRSQARQPAGNRRLPGYTFAFPRDHASHPDYKIEWWYYTGNVKAADGRRFGYQVTFFRVGVDHTPSNPSRWAIRDLHMTHLAVSDADGPALSIQRKTVARRSGPGGRRGPIAITCGTTTGRRRSGQDPGSGRQHVLRANSPQAGDRPHARRGQAARDQWHQRHQPEGRAGRQRVALLLPDSYAHHRDDRDRR